MTRNVPNQSQFIEAARTLAPSFRERAQAHDLHGRFVADNYRELKQHKLLSAGVPKALGGGGASHAELCEVLRELGQVCGSTALALSMHTHLVAAAVWRHQHGQPGEAMLRKVAADELVLVSTGAGDWIDSVGRAERVPGGYRVSALKRFASGSPAGDLAITSVPFEAGERGAEVLHFGVSLKAQGLTIREDWDTLGMRGTGSHSLELKDVFIAEEAISLRRPRGIWHPSWNVILTVAAPLYMAPYVGIAERAATLAREAALPRASDVLVLQTLGEVENAIATARMALSDMIDNARGYDFEPTVERANRALIGKTLTTRAAQLTVQKAVEVVGGGALHRRHELERLLRDVQGAPFHPLPEKKQLLWSARASLGLSPIEG